MPCLRAKKWTYVKACYRMESDKEEPCMKIVNTEEFNALMNEDAVLVDFFATWCGPCKMLSPIISEIADEYSNSIKVCKVNVDENQDLAMKYNIMNVPTLLFIKNEKIIKSSIGFCSKSDLNNIINGLL